MEKNTRIVIISEKGGGVFNNMDEAICLKRFFPQPEFWEFESFEDACTWVENTLAERYPQSVFKGTTLVPPLRGKMPRVS